MKQRYALWLALLSGLALGPALLVVLISPAQAETDRSVGQSDLGMPTLNTVGHLLVAEGYPAYAPERVPNCRYGVAAGGTNQIEWLPDLGVGWYLDFGAHSPNGPNGIEFVQVIRIKQDKYGCTYLSGYSVSPPLTEDGLGNLVRANPGALWLVGNEPDRGPSPGECVSGQDDTYPEVYAEAYHEVYDFIKQRDPTAQVGIAGLVEVTPGRIQYLDKVWQAYLQKFGTPMPVDVWNMHLYILSEVEWDGQPNGIANVAVGTDPALGMRNSNHGTPENWRNCLDPRDSIYCYAEHDNLTIFVDQIRRMRAWMKAHGQQNKPLILSEYSILFGFEDYDDPINPTRCWVQDEFGGCFTAARVTNFMTRTFNYLETVTDPNLGYPLDNYRLVQQWLWFSMYSPGAGKVSSLVITDATSLTSVGEVFSKTVHSLPTFANLLPAEVAHPVTFISPPNGTTSATLSVKIYNNGNTYTTSPITVTFYANSALTEVIGTSVFTDSLGGCARRYIVATAIWEGLSAGLHRYWVKVEGDSNTADSVVEGFVLVNPKQVFLPVVLR